MLNIVFDARSITTRKSGIGNYAQALLEHMVPRAEDMRFLVLSHPDVREPLLEHERVRQLPFPGETKSLRTVFQLGWRNAGFRGHDLYHSPADLVPLGLRCPSVVTLHDLMWIEAPELASAFLPVRLANGLWYRLNFRHSVGGASAIIAISQATADAIGRVYPADAHKTHVIHHGADLDRCHDKASGPRSLLDRWLSLGDRYSLIVGQGSPYKNHLRMVRAFIDATRDAPDHKLLLVRRFVRVDRAMTKLLARPDVRAKVVAIPYASDDELIALYRHARMLLFASLYEGFGLPVLEAMALGTPVLGSTAPAVREITGDGALHAIADDHDDLVRKMAVLDSDEDLRRDLIAAGRARAQTFSWSRCADATLAVYRDVIRATTSAR